LNQFIVSLTIINKKAIAVYQESAIAAIPNLRFHDIKILMTRVLYNS